MATTLLYFYFIYYDTIEVSTVYTTNIEKKTGILI